MAPALRKKPLCRLFAHHEAEAATQSTPTAQPAPQARAWSQTKPA